MSSLKRLILSTLLISFSVLIACKSGSISDSVKKEKENIEYKKIPQTEGNKVTKELARFAALKFANNYSLQFENFLKDKPVRQKASYEIKNILTIKEGNESASLYLINYKKNGFVVVPGDKRAAPILAFSEENKMPASHGQKIPGGLSVWLSSNADHIDSLKKVKNKNKGAANNHSGWNILLSSNTTQYKVPPDGGCEREFFKVEPILNVRWGQAQGYNNDAPYKGCSYPSNGKAYAGCVATAMAQVMQYHEYPNNYNWDIMPDESEYPNSTGSNEISELMRDVGDAVYMDYGCDASGAQDDDIEPGFRSMGYNSATQIGYAGTTNYNDVINNLDQGNPVVFTGYRDTDLGFIDKDGHAWVADGYTQGTVCPSGNSYTNFHMNWGWEGSYNGWFDFNNFDPRNDQYNSGTEVVVNIHP